MRTIFCLYVLSGFSVLFAAERLHVTVCNQGQMPVNVLARAQAEAAVVFGSFGVEVVWSDCEGELADSGTSPGLRFVIRLRNDAPPDSMGSRSSSPMGRAFTSATNGGTLADVDYGAAQWVARANAVVETDALLGCVMAHELGHLLLGPVHTSDGIMRATWNVKDMAAIQKRWLKFNTEQRARIRSELRSTKAPADGYAEPTASIGELGERSTRTSRIGG